MTLKRKPVAPVKRTLESIKHTGRKFIVVNRSVTCLLLKRAGKVQWFTLVDGKDGVPVRHADFWTALKAHSQNMDDHNVKMVATTPDALEQLLALEEHEATMLAERLEVRANA